MARRARRLTDQRHERYMRLALALARKAMGCTSPNPMVGAAVVKRGRIIATGYHRRAGLPHAEIEALRQAGARARGATLYVTLEPCNHTGRTPPCCDAILAAGISEVVVATQDPNPITNGGGLARLRRGGVRVTTGVLAAEAQRLNEPFAKVMRRGLPFAVAKIGQSLDGKIATARGESRWISSSRSRRLGHAWRSRVDALLVGATTVLVDDPLLTARGVGHRRDRPIKVIVDSHLRTPTSARCLSVRSPAPTLIATTLSASRRRRTLARRGAEIMTFPPWHGRVPLRALFRVLARRGIHSVLIEGGGETLASALAERLVDHAVFFIAPLLIGGRTAPGSVGGTGIRKLAEAIRLEDVTVSRAGIDWCVEGRVVYPKGAGGRRQGAGEPQPNYTRFSHAPRPMPHAPAPI